MSQRRGPPKLPKEEPAIPLDPSVAHARNIFIREQIEKVKQLKQEGKTKDEIKAEVSRFAEDYPQLFKMLVSNEGYNEATLRTMLSMLEKMGTSELSQHQASVIVGQRLYDNYVKPAVDKENEEKKK
jgi:hypothetical protein